MGAVAGGNHNPTITGVETITIDVENASTQLNLSKTTGATSLTVLAVSDEAPVFNNVPAELATFRVQNTTGTEAATFNYATGSNAAHTINLGDSTAGSTDDVDLGVITVTGNKGALTVNSDSVAGNSIFDLTANVATSLTLNTVKALELDSGGAGNGILSASKATTVDINASGGALVVDGAQTLSVATSIDIDADQNTTLTGAMDGAKATSLVVHADAGAAFEAKAPLKAEIVNLLTKQSLGVTDIANCLKRHKGQISEACAKMYNEGVLDRNEDKTYSVMKSRTSI